MRKVMFVCLGNICRSPMAEFMFLEKIRKLGLEDHFKVSSAGTSDEEHGNDMYPPVKEILRRKGIPFSRHHARRLTKGDYSRYDLFVAMDSGNIRNLNRLFGLDPGHKIRRMLEERDVADPWWTGDFETAYRDIDEGLDRIIEEVLNVGI